MINTTKLAVGVAALVAGGGLALGVASVASADPSTPPSSGSSASGRPSGQPGGERQKGTEVSGDEATKVSGAVTAKDSTVKVELVVKLADGSYRVEGTKDGARVAYTVSADLVTVSQAPEGPGRGGKGGAQHQHTDATAEETAKVTAAVKAKDAAVTVEKVVKDPDGSFDAQGTKDGTKVMVEVSADLQTVTVRAGR